MTTPSIERIVCRQCYAVLDATDNYCRCCGAPTPNMAGESASGRAAGLVQAHVVAEPPAKRPNILESPWVVLAMLFLVLGPLALPMLWRSRRFTLLWKVVLTAVVVAITALLLWAIWRVFQVALAPLKQLRDMPGF